MAQKIPAAFGRRTNTAHNNLINQGLFLIASISFSSVPMLFLFGFWREEREKPCTAFRIPRESEKCESQDEIYPTGIFRIWPGRMVVPDRPFTCRRAFAVTPGYFWEIEYKESPDFTL